MLNHSNRIATRRNAALSDQAHKSLADLYADWRQKWAIVDDPDNCMSDTDRDALMDEGFVLEVATARFPAETMEDLYRKIAMVMPNPEFCDEVRHKEATAALVREARTALGLSELGNRA